MHEKGTTNDKRHLFACIVLTFAMNPNFDNLLVFLHKILLACSIPIIITHDSNIKFDHLTYHKLLKDFEKADSYTIPITTKFNELLSGFV